jgi:protoporphyrinogen oxidase
MKIAVVGGGFTGLACALSLVENGVEVVLFEEGNTLGGLAGGVKEKNWKWSLEYFYHHVFTNDKEILALAKRVGVKTLIKKPVTTSLLGKKEIQLDSPLSVLRFSGLSFFGRIRMGIGLAILKLIPNGLFLEKYLVVEMLPRLIGIEGYRVVWEKMLKAKFGSFASTVNMAWFWTRVAKRTKNLGYFEEGFQKLADKTGEKIVKLGGEIRLGNKIKRIEKKENNKWNVDDCSFDGVVMTAPAPVAEKLLGKEIVTFPMINYLWGQTVVMELSEKLINGYWMNILEKSWPFLVVVEHTNMIDKKYYGNNRVVYLGNYLPEGHKQLEMTKDELITMYLPYLRKINKCFRKKWIKRMSVFRKPFAQPVFPLYYSALLPKIKSIHAGLYIANMSMVYPFDRGTNYAVKMGNDVAKQLIIDLK